MMLERVSYYLEKIITIVSRIFVLMLIVMLFVLFLSSFIDVLKVKRYNIEQEVRTYKEELKELKERLQKLEKLLNTSMRKTFIATAYTSCSKECDNTPFITASGQKVRWGIVAADKTYPFGTKIYIPYFGQVFEVQDRGGAIKGNRIDIWFQDRKEAIKFGVKKLVGYVWREEKRND